ncbi:hypothetical protein GCM10010255_61710 [Streptomyces coeruleofuscus]|uniref:Uncharacterized protein n=1 Tax=Streptomyces coeruleofuscus TaxID=66879 RepID=A0ABP5VYF8_9ACTN
MACGLLHVRLNLAARRALLLRMIRNGGLDVAGEVAPGPPRGFPRGPLLAGSHGLGRWTVLVLKLFDDGVCLIGGALHLHKLFEGLRPRARGSARARTGPSTTT